MKIPNSHFGYISVSQLEDDNYLVQEILSAENNPGSEHQSSETINSVAHDEASNVVKEGQLRLVNGRVENEVCLNFELTCLVEKAAKQYHGWVADTFTPDWRTISLK